MSKINMKKMLYMLLIFLMLMTVTVGISSSRDNIPKNDLPLGFTYIGVHDTSVDIGAISIAGIQGDYIYNNVDNVFVTIIKDDNADELAARYKSQYKDVGYDVFESISFNGHSAIRIKVFLSGNWHYRIMWTEDSSMILVGTLQDVNALLSLAVAVDNDVETPIPIANVSSDYVGGISVVTDPIRGQILFDGVVKGTGSWIETVSTGSHTISFGAVSGYITPSQQSVNVHTRHTAYITGTYVPVQTDVVMLETAKSNLNGIIEKGMRYETVLIKDNVFIPETISVKKGIFVVLYNIDRITHYVKLSQFENNGYYEIPSGDILIFLFNDEAGNTVIYQDRDFSNLKGKTVIEQVYTTNPVPVANIQQFAISLPPQRYVNQPLTILIANRDTGNAVVGANTRICLTNTNNCLALNTDANGNVAFRPLNTDYQIWVSASGYQDAYLRFDVTNSVSTPAVTYTARPEPTYTARPTVTVTPVITHVPKPGTLEDPNPGCWGSAFGFGMCAGSVAAKTGVGLAMGIGKGIVQLFGGE